MNRRAVEKIILFLAMSATFQPGAIASGIRSSMEQPLPSRLSLEQTQIFRPSKKSSLQSRKVDILFIIDNSGSMAHSQDQLIKAMPQWIEKLKRSTLDFHVAVTTTDSWRAAYEARPELSDLRRGFSRGRLRDTVEPARFEPDSGTRIASSLTPDLETVLKINLNPGIWGSGDERAFESMKTVLDFKENADFHRPGAYLSIVVVSDEDDFSARTPIAIANQYDSETIHDSFELKPSNDPRSLWSLYRDSRLIPVPEFQESLKAWSGRDKFSVSAIAILDETCKQVLETEMGGRRMGRRYAELSKLTGGWQSSICNITESLEGYAEFLESQIPTLEPYRVKLDRPALIETIVVKVNGRWIPNDPENGWSYEAAAQILTLHGASVPQKGDVVSISYDFVQPNNVHSALESQQKLQQ